MIELYLRADPRLRHRHDRGPARRGRLRGLRRADRRQPGIQIVGDDLFVTNPERLARGHRGRRRQLAALEGQPDRHAVARRSTPPRWRTATRLHGGRLGALRRDRGPDHRRPRRRPRRRPDQDRRAGPRRAHREVQPAARGSRRSSATTAAYPGDVFAGAAVRPGPERPARRRPRRRSGSRDPHVDALAAHGQRSCARLALDVARGGPRRLRPGAPPSSGGRAATATALRRRRRRAYGSTRAAACVVVGAGKATPGDRCARSSESSATGIDGGLVVVRRGHERRPLERIEVARAPTIRCRASAASPPPSACWQIARAGDRRRPRDRLLHRRQLGAGAACRPPGVTLEREARPAPAAARARAPPIAEVNAVRKHVSRDQGRAPGAALRRRRASST